MSGSWLARHKVVSIGVVAALAISVVTAASGAWSDVSSQGADRVGSGAVSPSAPTLGTMSAKPASPPATAPTKPSATSTRPAPPRAGTALAALARLPVKGRAPKTGYDREQFGQAWNDVDRNGCDTRNDILRRDLSTAPRQGRGPTAAWSCAGTLDDPYSGATIAFVRGRHVADVQIDHVVALVDAWQKGAQQLSTTTRAHSPTTR